MVSGTISERAPRADSTTGRADRIGTGDRGAILSTRKGDPPIMGESPKVARESKKSQKSKKSKKSKVAQKSKVGRKSKVD